MKETFKYALKNTNIAFLQLLFYQETKCEICSKFGKVICDECAEKLPRHESITCRKCGRQIKKEGLCYNCNKNPRPYDKGFIALFYQDFPKQIMREYKFHSKRYYSAFFAEEIYKKIDSFSLDIDIITAVPMHPIKLFGKGYNPPALIAKELSKISDISYNNKILERKRYTKSMSQLVNIDRMKHSEQNFRLSKFNCSKKNILIVDDVSTTGATLHVCSKILMDNGANKVYVASACGDSNNF